MASCPLLDKVQKAQDMATLLGLEVLIVRVTDDAAGAARQSKVHFDQYDVKSTAGVALGGKAGPPDYGLSDEVQMTVLLIDKEHKVLLNMARRAPERQDFDIPLSDRQVPRPVPCAWRFRSVARCQ